MSRGLGRTQLGVLRIVRERAPAEVPVAELASQLGVSSKAARAAVTRLRRDGLVVTRLGPVRVDGGSSAVTVIGYEPCLWGLGERRHRCRYCDARMPRYADGRGRIPIPTDYLPTTPELTRQLRTATDRGTYGVHVLLEAEPVGGLATGLLVTWSGSDKRDITPPLTCNNVSDHGRVDPITLGTPKPSPTRPAYRSA